MLGAAALVALHPIARRRFADALAVGVAAAVSVMCLVLLVQSSHEPIVYWFGGWRPRQGIALGVAFVIDPLGASMAAICALLVTAALVFSWRYFEAVGVLFHSLMLVFLAAMCGFCLSGDLFNIFVFFELMSVAAYALTGYKAEEAGPLQGALNFAITNSVGAFMVLVGIALLYGRTGALNLAQIGQSLQRHPVDGLVVVSFVFIVLGFLVKGAIVPFHFWLADAHAVAPTPVCVLFSGVMVELGLYASARVYWTVFHPVLATHEAGLRGLLVGVGTVTALLGAVMALAQGHVKRLLAFSTVSHAGLFLIGFGLFETRALAGVALYVMGHALVKGALFMTVGILLHRFGVVRLRSLIAHGRAMPITGSVFGLAALGLIGMPPFVTSLGKSLIEESANDVHYRWVTLVFVVASALSGAAVLRAGAQIFLGWEAPESNPGHATDLAGRLDIEFDTVRAPERVEAFETEPVEIEHRETEEGRSPTPAVMVLPAVALVLVALLTGLLPGISRRAESAAARFVDTPANASQVLHDVVATQSAAPTAATKPAGHAAASLGGAALGVLTALLAVGVALTALGRVRASRSVTRRVRGWSRPAMAPLRRLHSGHVGDYLAWLTFGVALFGGIAAAILR